MKLRGHPSAHQQLWEPAVNQYGFVTTTDVAEAGLTKAMIDSLVARGRLSRVAHGVYRFPEMPATEFDPYMLAVLWTGAPDACLSHDTALAAYEVCDINPNRTHVTVNRKRRIRRTGGERYIIHYEDLQPQQIGWWQQIPTVTLLTAIEQCIHTGVPAYLIRQAIINASKTGALRADDRKRLTTELRKRDGA